MYLGIWFCLSVPVFAVTLMILCAFVFKVKSYVGNCTHMYIYVCIHVYMFTCNCIRNCIYVYSYYVGMRIYMSHIIYIYSLIDLFIYL